MQHATIREILASIPLGADFTAPRAYATLVRLSAIIKSHLKMEDERLYAVLLKSPDEMLRRKAVEFARAMGGFAKTYDAFVARWMDPAAIADDPAGFHAEWRAVVEGLTERMNREDDDLYAAFDRLHLPESA